MQCMKIHGLIFMEENMECKIYKDFIELLEHLKYKQVTIEDKFTEDYNFKYTKNLFDDIDISIYINTNPVICDEYDEEILIGVSISSNKFQSIAYEFQREFSDKNISCYNYYEDNVLTYTMTSIKKIVDSEIETATIANIMNIGEFLSIIELISTKKDSKALYEFMFYSCFGQVVTLADFYMVYLFLSYISNISIKECIERYNNSYIFSFKRKYEIEQLNIDIVSNFYKIADKKLK